MGSLDLATGGTVLSNPRRGPARWLRSYFLMVVWEARSLRIVLPLAMVVQIILGAGLVIGFGFLLGEIPMTEALFLATGVTVISMITLGLVLVPQIIASRKQAGVYDYMWSLPVPRTASIAASLTVNSLISVPGMALALLVAWLRYDMTFSVSFLILPAALLTIVTAASVGFAMGHAIPNPMTTALITNVLVFVILLYSPINFPADRLPGWLATLHQGLPMMHAANVVRAGLTEGLASDVARSFAVLGAWAVAAWTVTAWVVGRRA
jgi:ABC-2 type transport system permease protein